MTEQKQRYSRSVSQYKSITRCGEAFRLSRMVKPRLQKRPAPWTGLGIALHQAFQAWEASDRVEDVLELFVNYYDIWVEESLSVQPNYDLWILPPNTKSTKNAIANYRKRGLERDVPLYRDRCLEAEWRIFSQSSGEKAIELEYELTFETSPFDEPLVVKGAIDRILFYPKTGVVALEDLKTGNANDDIDSRQLDLYALALKECFSIHVDHGRFWYTKLDRPGQWHSLNKSREYIAKTYMSVDSLIDQKLLLPNPGEICGLCDVKPWCREVGWLKEDEKLTSENLRG